MRSIDALNLFACPLYLISLIFLLFVSQMFSPSLFRVIFPYSI